MSKLAKFFIICGAVFIIGIGLMLVGVCSGGVEDIDKVAEEHGWMEGSPGVIQTETHDDFDYDSVSIDGTADVMICGTECKQNLIDFISDKDGQLPEGGVNPGDVVICWGENVIKPETSVDRGVLKIDIAQEEYDGAIEMNFTSEDGVPGIAILCPEEGLADLDINSPFGDVDIYGVTYESAKILSESSDVDLQMVTSGKLNVQGDCTDVELNGTFKGETSVTVTSGDINFETSLNRSAYNIDINAPCGDIEDGETELEGTTYERDGGEIPLKLRADTGDVDLWFGDTRF